MVWPLAIKSGGFRDSARRANRPNGDASADGEAANGVNLKNRETEQGIRQNKAEIFM